MRHTNRIDRLPNLGWDERILAFANPPLVQVFAVITDHYVVLVDTLINLTTARKVLEHLTGWMNTRPLLVVNTHADYDHAWGNQLFAGRSGASPAPIMANRRCAAAFAEPATAALLEEFRAREPGIFGDVTLTPPTVLFDRSLTVDGGDLTLELIHTPGHTPDHISVWLPEIATLLAGDAAELPFPFAGQSEDLPALRASLARLSALNPSVALYCHAPVASGPQLLHDNLAYFQVVEDSCRAALARGFSSDAVADEELPSALGCALLDVVPEMATWGAVDRTGAERGHAHQLRMMLEWLTGPA